MSPRLDTINEDENGEVTVIENQAAAPSVIKSIFEPDPEDVMNV